MHRFSKSFRKFIRDEKARIRRNTPDPEERKSLEKGLYLKMAQTIPAQGERVIKLVHDGEML